MKRNYFTEKEIEFIQLNYNKISSYKIAKILNRAQGIISRKIRQLGLKTGDTQQTLQKQGKRKCTKCQQIMDLNKFSLIDLTKTKLQSACKLCAVKMVMEKYYERYNSIEDYSKNIIITLTKRKICSLIPSDIINQFNLQNGLCFYSGEKLLLEINKLETISVDRINPDLPYDKNNIVLCCHIVNLMKQYLQQNEFIIWCNKIVKNSIQP
jgi:hypothetical protein